MDRLLELILHTDDALMALVSDNLMRAYLILFLIVFAETGVILFPFLPGDGLLFSAGVVAAATDLNILLLVGLFTLAAVSGNLCNYLTGNFFGHKLENSTHPLVRRYLLKYFIQTRHFYEKYGGKSIILSRFLPIVRTYIPFLAGVIHFPLRSFMGYTVAGALLWVPVFALSGYFLGEIPWVKNNYGLIFLGLIAITILPFLLKLAQAALRQRKFSK